MKNCRLLIIAAILPLILLSIFSGCKKNNSPEYVIYLEVPAVPFCYYDKESGGYIGISEEIISAISEDQKINITIKRDDAVSAEDAVLRGKADILLIASALAEPKGFDYSAEICKISDIIGNISDVEGTEPNTSSNTSDLRPYRFFVKRGTNKELLSKINAGLSDIKANGKLSEIMGLYGTADFLTK